MTKINPEFSKNIKKYGAFDMNACFNCGNCTAICTLSDENNSFPRKMVRASVLGLDGKIETSLDPWLCYYCGECSDTCPKEANPGELMMSLRRYLTSVYDWTGLSKVFYKYWMAYILGFIMIALGVLTLGYIEEFDTKAIMHFGHLFEIITILTVALTLILPNILRMYYLTVLKNKKKIPLSVHINKLWDLILHMFTQKQSLKCETGKFQWFEHLLLVFGYLTLLLTTVLFNWFSTTNIIIIVLGYISSGIISIFTFHFVINRTKKNKEMNKFSHPTDWFFVTWLFLLGFTALFVRVFVDMNIIEGNVWLYIVHITVLAQWALIIVPFGKWAHFLYRPFAIYFNNLIKTNKS